VELLDGLRYWRASDLLNRLVDTRTRRIKAIEEELAAAEASYRQARANANTTRNERLRRDYLSDAEQEALRIEGLESALAAERARPADSPEADSFDSECDFLAHALAGLVHHGEYAPRELVEALSTVLEFNAFRPVIRGGERQVEIEFSLLLPADGRVARFGPISCWVNNRAYPSTLRSDGSTGQLRAWLRERVARAGLDQFDAGSHRSAQFLAEQLHTTAGWTRLGAATLVRSGVAPLYRIATHVLWGDELPDEIDPEYVKLVVDTYSAAEFAWNGRHHALDCSLRQLCVDAVVDAGGELGLVDLEQALHRTPVDSVRITVYSRPQVCGRAPVWEPCLERRGSWLRQHPRTGRSLVAIRCPHCGGFASRVLRTPETPACLLCPDCYRMPRPGSPVFPRVYLHL
jgi:hypothetical protein